MTNGSSHKMCESKVHTYSKPSSSASRASSIVFDAGGFVCRTTPNSIAGNPLSVLVADEGDLRRRGVGPAAGDDFGSCVEVDALGPVHVLVAEQGCLPSA